MAVVRPRKNMPEHFGIRIVSAEKDKVVGEIDADGRHLNNRGIVHGGLLMTFADQAMGMTGRRKTGEKPHATIELNMQFIGGVKVGDFVEAHCNVVRETRSVLFIESKLKIGAQIIASASGIWKILGEG